MIAAAPKHPFSEASASLHSVACCGVNGPACNTDLVIKLAPAQPTGFCDTAVLLNLSGYVPFGSRA